MTMALLSPPQSGTPVVVSPSSSSTFRSSSSFIGLLSVFLFLVLVILLGHCSSPSSAVYLAYRHNRNKSNQLHQRPLTLGFNETQCNIFMGSWVYDDTYPMYQSSQCPFIDPQFNCQLNGRPDSSYLKYSWIPATCKLPRFNGEEFLLRMEGKTVMFVGDSLGKNQWESLACMISTALPNSPTMVSRSVPLSTIKFVEYDVALSFYKAPYLVDIDLVQGKRVLKLDDISGNGNSWRGVDVLVFNSGHWWAHTGSFQGWDYMESGGKYYQDMDRLTAFEHGLSTWAKWIDANIDTSRTKVFFKSISPTHYNPTQMSAGGTGTPAGAINSVSPSKNCYGETMPTAGMTYPANGYRTEYGGQMKAIDSVLKEMKYPPPYLLDITMLSAMRKDAHPSVYSSDLTPSQRPNPSAADCSHWCVPGLPDTWNQLLYTALFFKLLAT